MCKFRETRTIRSLGGLSHLHMFLLQHCASPGQAQAYQCPTRILPLLLERNVKIAFADTAPPGTSMTGDQTTGSGHSEPRVRIMMNKKTGTEMEMG